MWCVFASLTGVSSLTVWLFCFAYSCLRCICACFACGCVFAYHVCLFCLLVCLRFFSFLVVFVTGVSSLTVLLFCLLASSLDVGLTSTPQFWMLPQHVLTRCVPVQSRGRLRNAFLDTTGVEGTVCVHLVPPLQLMSAGGNWKQYATCIVLLGTVGKRDYKTNLAHVPIWSACETGSLCIQSARSEHSVSEHVRGPEM